MPSCTVSGPNIDNYNYSELSTEFTVLSCLVIITILNEVRSPLCLVVP